ncbi:MAG: hypothetical protein B7C24_18240 [Bacteroidetes bacterium 4572_77]|nr:MAG: hypothetical protein B7C24_18240 [Bacteroidetes bacterium 4572_77]
MKYVIEIKLGKKRMKNFEVQELEKGTIIYVSGALMSDDVADEFKHITYQAGERDNKNLILDFSNTTLIGSLLIGLLVRIQAHFDKIDGNIAFCGFTESINDVLSMTKVMTFLNTYKTLEEAKRIFN